MLTLWWSELDTSDILGLSVLSRPPSLCLQCRGQLVVGANGGTHPGSLHRWHCVPGHNSPQHTTESSEAGELCTRKPERNRIAQGSPHLCHFHVTRPTPLWLHPSRALPSRAICDHNPAAIKHTSLAVALLQLHSLLGSSGNLSRRAGWP